MMSFCFPFHTWWSILKDQRHVTRTDICACRESNPGHKHGRLVCCRYTTCACDAALHGRLCGTPVCALRRRRRRAVWGCGRCTIRMGSATLGKNQNSHALWAETHVPATQRETYSACLWCRYRTAHPITCTRPLCGFCRKVWVCVA